MPIRVAGMQDQPEFREVIMQGRRDRLDVAALEREVLDVTDQLGSDVGAIVLECTDLAPFAAAIRARTGLAVFDVTTLTRMVHAAVRR